MSASSSIKINKESTKVTHLSNSHEINYKPHSKNPTPLGKVGHGDIPQSSTISAIERNQIPMSVSALVLLAIVHQFPQCKEITSNFFNLQYNYPNTIYYDIGVNDSYFVVLWIVLLTFIRSFTMEYMLKRVAILNNITSDKAQIRFAEQGWMVICYSISFGMGLYLYYGSDYWLSCDYIYIGWPHTQMTYLFKCYYLVQIAFWFQQIFVLNIEARRKDHIQMFSHHIITCLLIVSSYYYYFTRIGNVILVLMDSGDIFLSGAKVLKYCGYSSLCDLMFYLFFVSWIILRHGVYNYILYHGIYKSYDLMPESMCVNDILMKRCWTVSIMRTFFSLLGFLQILTIIWMYFIIRVVIKVFRGTGADDVRSDAEDTDEENEGDNEELFEKEK